MAEIGIGWRQPHYAELLERQPAALDFIEVHSENFFAAGGAAPAVLSAGRERYAVSLHGVGLSLGSACGVDGRHLEQLAALVGRIEPVRVSDHASFGRVDGGLHANDLLPVPFSEPGLQAMRRNVDAVQQRLGRPLLVENLSAYVGWDEDTLAEPEFFNELTRRSGCGLLLDVNNLVVNARNAGAGDDDAAVARACAWIDALRPGIAIGEIHVAGHARLPGGLVIDDHGSRVGEAAWRVLAHARRRFGPVPTLVEWDTDVPALDVLLGEAQLARELMSDG